MNGRDGELSEQLDELIDEHLVAVRSTVEQVRSDVKLSGEAVLLIRGILVDVIDAVAAVDNTVNVNEFANDLDRLKTIAHQLRY